MIFTAQTCSSESVKHFSGIGVVEKTRLKTYRRIESDLPKFPTLLFLSVRTHE